MKLDFEHGIANRLYRAFAAFMPLRRFPYEPLTLEKLARRYARGNVKLQMVLNHIVMRSSLSWRVWRKVAMHGKTTYVFKKGETECQSFGLPLELRFQ